MTIFRAEKMSTVLFTTMCDGEKNDGGTWTVDVWWHAVVDGDGGASDDGSGHSD